MHKRLLVTGGAGFIGSKLVKFLHDNTDFDIVVLDNFNPQVHSNPNEHIQYLSNFCTVIVGDICCRETVEMAIEGVDFIYHLASETGTGQSMYKIEQYTNVNIQGTSVLLDVISSTKNSVSKFILSSSRSIYGEGKYFCKTHDIVYPYTRDPIDLENSIFELKCPHCSSSLSVLPTDESSLLSPQSIYALTKRVQEELVLSVCKNIDVSPLIFRFQNVYGPGQSLSNPYTGILSIFSTRILNNNIVNVFEDGYESRDFVFVDDVVDCLHKALSYNGSISTFNVGSGCQTTVLDIISYLGKDFGVSVNYEITGDYRKGDIRHNFADISLVSKELGWAPVTSIVDGISLFAEWVKQQPVQKDTFEESIKELKQFGIING